MAMRQVLMKLATTSILIILLLSDFLETVLAQSNNDVRLVGGSLHREGRVEIYHASQWGTICDDLWGAVESQVVCRQLGYEGYSDIIEKGAFGQGTGMIWLDDVSCTGMETSLSPCSHRDWGSNDCTHAEDVGVRCTVERDGSLRIAGGPTANEGRIEIYHDWEWGTVCDSSWDMSDGFVACRQLGYSGVETVGLPSGPGTGTIWLDKVQCGGIEETLVECSHGGWGIHNCDHSNDARIRCSPGGILSGGAIAGIVIGSLVGVFLVYLCCRCRKKKPPTHQHTSFPMNDVSREGAVAFDSVHGGQPDPNNIHPEADAANLPPPSYNDIRDFDKAPYPPASAPYPQSNPPHSAPYLPPTTPYPPPTAPYPPPTVTYPPPTATYPPPNASYPPPSSLAASVTYPYPSGDPGVVPSAPPAHHPTNPAYPPTNPAYPPISPAHPPTNPAHPPTNPAHPPTSPAYPPTSTSI